MNKFVLYCSILNDHNSYDLNFSAPPCYIIILVLHHVLNVFLKRIERAFDISDLMILYRDNYQFLQGATMGPKIRLKMNLKVFLNSGIRTPYTIGLIDEFE